VLYIGFVKLLYMVFVSCMFEGVCMSVYVACVVLHVCVYMSRVYAFLHDCMHHIMAESCRHS
jgi:hypothetical protein